MQIHRRSMLRMTAGALAFLPGSRTLHAAAKTTVQQLNVAAEAPVLKRELFTSPAIIDSIELLRGERDYFVRVRSRDGTVGVSVTNSRAAYLYPILNGRVIPYFRPGKIDMKTHLTRRLTPWSTKSSISSARTETCC